MIELIGTPFTGVGNRDVDFNGKLVTVRSQGGDPDQCVIDCQRDGRGFVFHSGEDNRAVLRAITITNGHEEYGDGGGIYISSSSPWIEGCRIVNCGIGGYNQYRGGGIYCAASASPVLTDCEISDCSAGSARYRALGGAGIYSDESSFLTMRNCVVADNYLYGGNGAGIACANGEMSGCTINSNDQHGAGRGGGIYCEAGVIANCNIQGNSGVEGAGCAAGANTTIQDCVIAASE